MGTVSSFYLFIVAIFIVCYVMNQVVRGSEDLVSLRNFFLAGMIIFQVTGTALSILTNDVAYFQPTDIDSSSVQFALMLTVFMILFLGTYQRSTRIIDKIMARASANRGASSYSPMSLLVLAGATIGFGLLSQYVLIYIPVLGPGFQKLAYGLYAIAAGLATWVAAPRLYNPFFLVMSSSVVLLAMGLTFANNFGRRDILGVVLAVLWSLYFCHWRSLGVQRSVTRMFVVSFAGLVLMGLVTSARSENFRDQSALQNISALKDASASEGIKDVLYGQRAGLNSMWLIESRPDSHAYDTLHSLRLILAFPVPRAVWHEKPDALGLTMPENEVKHSNKSKGWNVGPGIIGHITNDNPWIALWLYPIGIAFAIRFFDRAVVWFSANPFVVLPMGSAIGQMVALPRGELGTFFFFALLNIVTVFVIMHVMSSLLKFVGLIKPLEDEYWDDYDTDHDHALIDYWDEHQSADNSSYQDN